MEIRRSSRAGCLSADACVDTVHLETFGNVRMKRPAGTVDDMG